MKRYIVFVLCVSLAGLQMVSADWSDDFSSYADDTAIQAVYGNGGCYRSPYTHVSIQDTYAWSSTYAALGVTASNGDYALRALNRQAGSIGISATAWMLPFSYSVTTGHNYYAEMKLCCDTNWPDYHVRVQMINGKFRVLDYDTDHYLSIDLDGDGDIDTNDTLKEDTYYKIRIDARPDTVNGGVYDVYVNDIMVYTNAGYRSTLATNDTTYLRFSRGESGGPTVAIDDVEVRSIMPGGWTEDFSGNTTINAKNYYWSGNYMGYTKLPYVSPYGHGGTTSSSYIYGDEALGLSTGAYAVQPLGKLERPATVEFWVNVAIYSGTAGGTGHVYICSSEIGTPGGVDNTSCWQTRLDFTSGTKMKVYDGTDDAMHEVGTTMAARTYYKIKLVTFPNKANGGMYNVYLDDSLVYSGAKFKSAYANKIPTCIKLTHDPAGSYKAPFAFDDFTVTDSPPLGTIIFVK